MPNICEVGRIGETQRNILILDVASSHVLSESVLSSLSTHLSYLLKETHLDQLCLRSASDIFLAGVDLDFIRAAIEAGEVDRVLRFTHDCHRLLDLLSTCELSTIAWVCGPAFGAGLELALACDRIVASNTAKFSFPETGLGIYPGMGGTQRLPRRIGVGLAKWMIYTGAIVPAGDALAIGLIDALDDGAALAADALATLDSPAEPESLPARSFAAIEGFFLEHDVATILSPSLPAPSVPSIVRAVVQVRSKAPLALFAAERLIDRGLSLPLAAALDEELAGLRAIFDSNDARLGLASQGRSRPRFAGR